MDHFQNKWVQCVRLCYWIETEWMVAEKCFTGHTDSWYRGTETEVPSKPCQWGEISSILSDWAIQVGLKFIRYSCSFIFSCSFLYFSVYMAEREALSCYVYMMNCIVLWKLINLLLHLLVNLIPYLYMKYFFVNSKVVIPVPSTNSLPLSHIYNQYIENSSYWVCNILMLNSFLRRSL